MQKVAYFTVQHHDFASVYKFDNSMLMIILLSYTYIRYTCVLYLGCNVRQLYSYY